MLAISNSCKILILKIVSFKIKVWLLGFLPSLRGKKLVFTRHVLCTLCSQQPHNVNVDILLLLVKNPDLLKIKACSGNSLVGSLARTGTFTAMARVQSLVRADPASLEVKKKKTLNSVPINLEFHPKSIQHQSPLSTSLLFLGSRGNFSKQ